MQHSKPAIMHRIACSASTSYRYTKILRASVTRCPFKASWLMGPWRYGSLTSFFVPLHVLSSHSLLHLVFCWTILIVAVFLIFEKKDIFLVFSYRNLLLIYWNIVTVHYQCLLLFGITNYHIHVVSLISYCVAFIIFT